MLRILLAVACIFTPILDTSTLLLITGCGRSGTTYIAKVFKGAGYNVNHENEEGRFGSVDWHLALPEDRYRAYSVVLHQIRNPIDTIASAHTLSLASWEYISRRLPHYNDSDSLLVKCTKYWLYWNQLAESHADFSYPLEKLEENLGKINHLVGCKLQKKHLYRVLKTTNSRPHLTLTWEMLQKQLDPELFSELVTYAEKWGYTN